MGDIADQMVDGTLCSVCGEYLFNGGFPGVCRRCSGKQSRGHAVQLSPAMRKMLANLAQGKPIGIHLKTRSEHGGAEGTIAALIRRGLITPKYELTAFGRRVISAQGVK